MTVGRGVEVRTGAGFSEHIKKPQSEEVPEAAHAHREEKMHEEERKEEAVEEEDQWRERRVDTVREEQAEIARIIEEAAKKLFDPEMEEVEGELRRRET